jgi:predicted nucleic acid-binding protein
MKYYIAVYEKLREIYLSRGAMENDLPMICPSLRMYENEDLELLKPMSLLDDQQKKIESIIRKQNISYELNSVPISPFFWMFAV